MFAKVHKRVRHTGGNPIVEQVVALCDAELLGRVFEENDLFLDLKSHRGFYEGNRVSAKAAGELLKGAGNANIVGEKSVAAAKKAFGKVNGVVKIQGVPHLQIYRV